MIEICISLVLCIILKKSDFWTGIVSKWLPWLIHRCRHSVIDVAQTIFRDTTYLGWYIIVTVSKDQTEMWWGLEKSELTCFHGKSLCCFSLGWSLKDYQNCRSINKHPWLHDPLLFRLQVLASYWSSELIPLGMCAFILLTCSLCKWLLYIVLGLIISAGGTVLGDNG